MTEIESANTALAQDPRASRYANLKATMTSLEWFKFQSTLYQLVLASPRKIKSHPAEPVAEANSIPRPLRSGFERTIKSEELDLVGRLDFLKLERKSAEVIDFKSGAVPLDFTQLELYALLLLTAESVTKVRARYITAEGSSPTREFSTESLAHRRESLKRLISIAPRNVPLSASALATAGPHCKGCQIRHRCSVYLDEAPKAWRSPLLDWWPSDTWGVVTEIIPKASKLITIRLLDKAGRIVAVDGLADSHFRPELLGNVVYVFSAGRYPAASTDVHRTHPLNFFEVPIKRNYSRAWGIATFVNSRSDADSK